MEHIVLLGDSVFDNAPYVSAGCDVASQLRARLGPRHRVSLLAHDGDVIADVERQLAQLNRLEAPPTWLVVSCGGNDVLGLVGAMHSPARSVLEAAEMLANWQSEFAGNYRRMLDVVLARAKPTAIATIYDGVPGLAAGLRTALAPFNDVILREAVERRLPVLDMRTICHETADYAAVSPIEPSAQGAGKIAATISELVTTHHPASPHAVVYGAVRRPLPQQTSGAGP